LSLSPFNVADRVINANFTEDETLRLFGEFARDTFEPSVVKDIWLKSDGYVLILVSFLATHCCLAIPAWFAFVGAQFLTT
jgi:hypothetical protein